MGKFFVFYSAIFLPTENRAMFLTRHTLVVKSGTGVAPLLFLGTGDSLYCFVLMEIHQLHFPFQVKCFNSIYSGVHCCLGFSIY
jgi:hypothetical protein